MRSKFLFFIATLFMMQAHAAIIEQPLADPAKETQAREMFRALRCVVCEGQSLAESDAKLAVQMRSRIRVQLAAGKTPEEIYAGFQRSYGDRILMNPPLDANTLLLWAMPLLLLVLGGGLIWRMTRRVEGV